MQTATRKPKRSKPQSRASLTPKQRAANEAMHLKCATSCLGVFEVKELGFVAMTEDESKALKLSRPGEGFRIPYLSIDGNATGMFRYRYSNTTGTFGIKLNKYDQPGNTRPEAYFPHLKETDWRSIASDPTKDLCLTEGELKAACATKYGHPTIGLGGVWSFQSKGRGIPFLPELEKIVWKNRRVNIIYDSDSKTNPDIMRALNRLAALLTERGADVFVVDIPDNDDNVEEVANVQ